MRHPMRSLSAILLALTLALAPTIVDARPGLGGSFGSRGSHTYSAPPSTSSAPYGASPFSRSMTPNSGYGYGNSGYGGYGYGSRYGYGRSAFTSGLLGGLIGAGIGGMLFGRGFFGFHGGFGFLGLLLQLFLLFLLARWLMTRFFRVPAAAGPGFGLGGFARNMFSPGLATGRPQPGFGGGRGRPITLSPADYQEFSRLLQGIQAAWSNQDMITLQSMTTPEMTGYFNEQLSDLASRGERNTVTDVRLLQGDLSEAWAEGNREYATVSMRYSIIDVTRDASGRIVDGSPTERVTVTEFWTFVRASGGHWILSAIQQSR